MSSRLNGTLVFLPLKILFTLLLFYLSYIAEGLINLCTPPKTASQSSVGCFWITLHPSNIISESSI